MLAQKSCEAVFERTIRRSLVGVLPTIAWLLSPNAASAELPHYRLELSVPQSLPECNREPDLIGMVLPMLARPMLEPPATRVVEVKIGKIHGVYRLKVVVSDLEGQTLDEEQTEFDANMSCFEVLYRGALRAAVQMNKGVNVAKAAPAQLPPPPSLQCPETKPYQKGQPTQDVERHWHVGLGTSTILGAAPITMVGLQFTVGWYWAPSWFIEGNVRGTFSTDALPNGVTPIHIESLGTATIAPCYRFGSIGGCGLVTWNAMWGRSIGLRHSGIDSVHILGTGIRGFIEHRFSNRWSVRLDGDFVFPITVLSLGDMAEQERWKPSPINGAINAALFASF